MMFIGKRQVQRWLLCAMAVLAASCNRTAYEGPASGSDAGSVQPVTPAPFTLVSVTPSDGTMDVPVDTIIQVRFSTAPLLETVTTDSLCLVDGETGLPVPVVIQPVPELDGTDPVRFNVLPESSLEGPHHAYQFEVKTCVVSKAGECLNIDASDIAMPVHFETGLPPDTEAPYFFFTDTRAEPAGPSAIRLSWSIALDPGNRTAPLDIFFRVYAGLSSDAIDLAVPVVTTQPGVRECLVTGLSPDTMYYFIVHPVDQAGNEDDNEYVVWARTFLAAETTELTVLYSSDVFATLEPCG